MTRLRDTPPDDRIWAARSMDQGTAWTQNRLHPGSIILPGWVRNRPASVEDHIDLAEGVAIQRLGYGR